MKVEKTFKIEWDTDKIQLNHLGGMTESDIESMLYNYYIMCVTNPNIPMLTFKVTEMKNEQEEDEKVVLELSLFNVPEYKMIDAPNFQMEINGKSTSIITTLYNLDILSDKRFNDLYEDERDDFIASMDAELDMINSMFVYQIIEMKSTEGLYRYVLRGVH